jgi:hypothetical protein
MGEFVIHPDYCFLARCVDNELVAEPVVAVQKDCVAVVQLMQVFLLECRNVVACHTIVDLLILVRLKELVLVFETLALAVPLLVLQDVMMRPVEQRKQLGYVYIE